MTSQCECRLSMYTIDSERNILAPWNPARGIARQPRWPQNPQERPFRTCARCHPLIEPALFRAARLDMPWPSLMRPQPSAPKRKSKMSKMNTKSGAKKRFKITKSGKIKTHQVGKRHRLINNSPARTRDLRGMDALSSSETRRVKRWMPYGGGI